MTDLAVSAGGGGCGGGIGGCCSGPGLSKRRRQAGTCSGAGGVALAGGGQPGVTGPGGVGPGQDIEEGAGGNNSEDEYENAARLQSQDPATVEQGQTPADRALQAEGDSELAAFLRLQQNQHTPCTQPCGTPQDLETAV